MINLLIAMFSESYERTTEDHAKAHWHLQSARQCFFYIRNSSAGPVPLNLVTVTIQAGIDLLNKGVFCLWPKPPATLDPDLIYAHHTPRDRGHLLTIKESLQTVSAMEESARARLLTMKIEDEERADAAQRLVMEKLEAIEARNSATQRLVMEKLVECIEARNSAIGAA